MAPNGLPVYRTHRSRGDVRYGAARRRSQGGGERLRCSILLLTPFVVAVFFCGVFLGGTYMHRSDAGERPPMHHVSPPRDMEVINSGSDAAAPAELVPGNHDLPFQRKAPSKPPPPPPPVQDVDPGALLKNVEAVPPRGNLRREDEIVAKGANPAIVPQPPPVPAGQKPALPVTAAMVPEIEAIPAPAAIVLAATVPAAATKKGGLVPFGDLATPAATMAAKFLHARLGCYAALKDTLDVTEDLTATAWVWLDGGENGIKPPRNMRTVVSNKMSGCDAGALGYALYVNGWEQDDGMLWLEWGDGQNGCRKLSSPGRVPTGRWVHLAVRFGGGQAALFIDGAKVLESPGSRRLGTSNTMHLGAFPRGEFPLFGKISDVIFFSAALADEAVAAAAAAPPGSTAAAAAGAAPPPAVVAAFPLDDAMEEKDGGIARDVSAKKVSAVYHFPAGAPPPVKIEAAMKAGDFAMGFSDGEVVTPQMKAESDRIGATRAAAVRAAMEHAWKGYKDNAWGMDEVKPQTGQHTNNWGGMGVTLVDSLDTLWLMGMKDKFWEARDWVRDHLRFDNVRSVSLFETTIRQLGGLLAAFDLSGDVAFRNKAVELADRLLPAFNTGTGIPLPSVDLSNGQARQNSWSSGSVLAEFGTLQVEFRYLSHVTGDGKYADAVNKVFELMASLSPQHGLYPINVNPSNGQFTTGKVTFGALGDSFYEYLLKVYLQGGKTETVYREMYDRAMDGVMEVILKKASPSGMAFLADWNGHSNDLKMDHLACFLGASLALGTLTGTDKVRGERDLKVAQALGYTCYQMYKRQSTGLAPEFVVFPNSNDMVVPPNGHHYLLRPETVETLFVLHQVTGNPIYREWSWEIFQSIEKHCRTQIAYGAFPDVTNLAARPDDRMESFFLAETLKYLYLIQQPDQPIDLMRQVFNTEAHPLRIFPEYVEGPAPPAAKHEVRMAAAAAVAAAVPAATTAKPGLAGAAGEDLAEAHNPLLGRR